MTGDPRKQHLDIGIDMSPGEKDINMDVASPPPPDYQQNQQNMRLTQQDFTDSEQKELVEKHLWYSAFRILILNFNFVIKILTSRIFFERVVRRAGSQLHSLQKHSKRKQHFTATKVGL